MNLHKFQIQYLRQKNIQALMESLVIMVGALFIAVLLPQVLVRFLYANQQLYAEPLLLQLIPAIALVVGVLQLLITFVGNFMRSRRLVKLEKTMIDQVNQMTTGIDQSELMELEKLVDSALTKHAPKAAKRTRTTKTKQSKTTSTRKAKAKAKK